MGKYQEAFRTMKGVFDEFTNRNLFELQSHGIFDELLSPVKVGKESNVFLAKKGEKLLIVKIYRLQNCDFNKMYNYIKVDPRYEYLKKHRREIIFAWTQREYKNLLRAEKAKVNVPKVIKWKFNILVEEMIGESEPAWPLKDADPDNPADFLKKVVEQMRRLYKGGLIHGDLSAFNILNFNEEPYLIDFSQSTLSSTPNAKELLERDAKNMAHYFRKRGIKITEEEIISIVTKG